MMKKVLKNVGEKNIAPGLKESLKKCIPDSKVVMGRAKRGLYAGRHIQFGNRVSEDGGNKYVLLSLILFYFSMKELERLGYVCVCVFVIVFAAGILFSSVWVSDFQDYMN